MRQKPSYPFHESLLKLKVQEFDENKGQMTVFKPRKDVSSFEHFEAFKRVSCFDIDI